VDVRCDGRAGPADEARSTLGADMADAGRALEAAEVSARGT
jgi:hypothetical protein